MSVPNTLDQEIHGRVSTTNWQNAKVLSVLYKLYKEHRAPTSAIMSDNKSPEEVREKMDTEQVEEQEYEEEEEGGEEGGEEEEMEEKNEKQQVEGESGAEEEREEREEQEGGGEQEGEGGGEQEGEEEGEEEGEGNELTDYVIQHGAHREFKMRKKFITHEAKKAMKVKDGLHIGTMLNSKAGKVWEGMKYHHIHIVGGTLKTTGKDEFAPFLCFDPGDGVDTDDKNWLRPIWAAVMAYWQPKWKQEIKDKFANDRDKMKRILKHYKPVLEWSPDDFTGPKLNPASLGVGKAGLVVMKDKLKSVRTNPGAVPRGQSKTAVKAATKLTSAIQKGGKAETSSSNDQASDQGSDITTVGSHTVRIGDATTTTAFVSGGVLYATFLHA